MLEQGIQFYKLLYTCIDYSKLSKPRITVSDGKEKSYKMHFTNRRTGYLTLRTQIEQRKFIHK
jgi:hypothetical protein